MIMERLDICCKKKPVGIIDRTNGRFSKFADQSDELVLTLNNIPVYDKQMVNVSLLFVLNDLTGRLEIDMDHLTKKRTSLQ